MPRVDFSRPNKWFIGMSLACLSMLASAEALLVESAGANVEYRHASDSQWMTLTAGSKLALPVEVRTLDNAEAVISQAGSTFTLRSNTQLAFKGSDAEKNGLVARVKQWIGTAFYKIERQPDEFSVETPFLVSTVKGTQFIIVSTEADSFVTLTEGSLQVLDLETGNTQMIAPGEIAGSSAGQSGARTYNRQSPQASTTNSASSTPSRSATVRQDVQSQAPAGKATSAPGQAKAPGLNSVQSRQDEPGRGVDKEQGRDRGRGFAAALEAIDEVRSEQIQTRNERSQRPLTPEDIRDARDDAGKDGAGRGPGAGSGNDQGRPGGGPDDGNAGSGPNNPPRADTPVNNRPNPSNPGRDEGRDNDRNDRDGPRGNRDDDDREDDG